MPASLPKQNTGAVIIHCSSRHVSRRFNRAHVAATSTWPSASKAQARTGKRPNGFPRRAYSEIQPSGFTRQRDQIQTDCLQTISVVCGSQQETRTVTAHGLLSQSSQVRGAESGQLEARARLQDRDRKASLGRQSTPGRGGASRRRS
jgi:hypothetical protein